MSPENILILFCIGLVAGWINVMAGGGSLLTVPAMLFMGVPGPVANGTNRIAILVQNIVAVTAFCKNGYSDFRLSASLALFAAVGGFAGAMVGVQLHGVWFNRVVAAIMIAVMALMVFKPASAARTSGTAAARNLLAGHLLMLVAGFWGGFIQIGVGFVLMPILNRVMGLDLVRVNMHKVFIILVFTIVALAVFASQVAILWWTGLGLAAGNAIGGWLGAHTSIRGGEVWIKRVYFVALCIFIVKLLFDI